MSGGERGLAMVGPGQVMSTAVAELSGYDYLRSRQPYYGDSEALAASMSELHVTTGVTQPAQIDSLSSRLAMIAEGSRDLPVVIVGGCNEPVDANNRIGDLVRQSEETLEVVSQSALRHAVTILRNRGQNAKPRSSSQEELPNGETITAYMGDAVNGSHPDPESRVVDPRRMVAAAVQARDLEAGLTTDLGYHVPAAHEALLLPYERSFVRHDSTSGDYYLLSTDLPWIGVRSNSPYGEHADLLASIENPVGVKIGPESTPEHIVELAEALNPDSRPGKLVLMFRLGVDNIDKLPPLLRAVKDHAPESILMNDIHGATRTLPNGRKFRLVRDIIQETQAVAVLCQAGGLKLRGLHLETITDDKRLECIDQPGQKAEKGSLDPQLNPRQTRRVLNAVAPYLALGPA